MEIKFYPYDFDYKLREKKPYLYLYSKLENGEKICVLQPHPPFFYAKVEAADKETVAKRLAGLALEASDEPARVLSWEETEKELLGKKEKLWKIFTNYPKAVPLISRELESWGINCYEKDILFVHRYLRDKKITPLTLVQAKGEFINDILMRVPVFLAEEVSPFSKEALQKVKILAVDIETYAERKEIAPEKNPLLMVGLYGIDEEGKEFKKVITWKKFAHHLDYLEFVSDEAQMLQRFRDLVLEYRPDVLTGYFSDGFDLPYLKIRAEKYKIKLDLGLDYSELEISRGDFREGKSRIHGILHLDVLKFIRNIFGKNLKTDSYKLDAVAEELLGHKKHEVNLNKLTFTWDHEPDKLEEFCRYNLHDAQLTAQLCQKLLFDMVEFGKIIGLPLFDVIRMKFSRLVENYILTRAMDYQVLAPNKPKGVEMDERQEESIKGGFVYEPIPGLYKDLVVFDFRSLYPTIITAHNIGPEGFRCSCCRESARVPGQPDYWFCTKEKKFIPQVLEELILRRADLKRLLKEAKAKREDTTMLEARSYALKTLANSFYGYLGFFGARWYCLECAASTTAYARNYIQSTIKKAEEKGFRVVYSDTDSCFLLLGDKVLDQAKEFMNEINFDLPGQMELELEGYYPQGIFVAQKGSERGAKKRYALISPEGRVKITGFETVRRNSSLIAKEVQEKVLRLVLQDRIKEALHYVKETIKELRKGTLPLEKVVIKTQITKELSDYAAIGPHVAVAQKMLEKGERIIPGMTIEYIIVKGSGLVRNRAKVVEETKEGEYDSEYYINNQLIPAVLSIFAVFGYAEDEIFRESSQVGLGKFF